MPGRRSPFHHGVTNVSIPPSLTARTLATTGTSVNLLQRGLTEKKLQRFRTAMLIVVTGDAGDMTHTFKIQESDDNSTWSDVATKHLNGPNIVIDGSPDDDNRSYEQGYVGHKQYLRAVTTVNAGVVGAAYTATFLLDGCDSAPVDR